MRKIIKEVDIKNKAFYCIHGKSKVGFYLTTRLAKLFFDYLGENILVDFEISDKVKTIKNGKVHQVLHFNEIIDIKNKKTIYNHYQLKQEMVSFLENKEYYLFLDLEMTIPYYKQKKFRPEIVQFGYLLSDRTGHTIIEASSYLKPVEQVPINKKILRFINTSLEEYESKAKDYSIFYENLKKLINEYRPKIVVWGKNDIIALDFSYDIHKLAPITNKNDFIDLLKLHKDYFNLKNDLGLFKAYETYYKKNVEQIHDAKDDAKITKKVFDAFMEYTSKELN